MSFAYPNEFLLEWNKILTPFLATVGADCFLGIFTSTPYSLAIQSLDCTVSMVVTGPIKYTNIQISAYKLQNGISSFPNSNDSMKNENNSIKMKAWNL